MEQQPTLSQTMRLLNLNRLMRAKEQRLRDLERSMHTTSFVFVSNSQKSSRKSKVEKIAIERAEIEEEMLMLSAEWKYLSDIHTAYFQSLPNRKQAEFLTYYVVFSFPFSRACKCGPLKQKEAQKVFDDYIQSLRDAETA